MTALDVIVIGAGVAGVTAARELAGAGLRVCVVEARDRVGGRVQSIRDFCEGAVEAGAEFVHGIDAATRPALRAAGLGLRPCPMARGSLIEVDGRPRWPPWLMRHPEVWPVLTILRRAQRFAPPDCSAREFIERQGYRGRGRILAEMTLTGHLPGSLDEVGMLGLREDGVVKLETGLNHRVREGYDGLPAFLASGLDVRLGFAVEGVGWSGDGVWVRSTGGRELAARTAICTLPVGVLQSGSVRFEPELPAGKQRALAGLVMGPVLKLLMRFARGFWPRWMTVMGCTGPVGIYWPPFYGADRESGVLTAYATGPRAAQLSTLSQEEAVERAVADLERLFPKADPRGALRAWRCIDWAADPFARGGYSFLRPGAVGARRWLAAADTGALFWGGDATKGPGIAATVEAAYLSGRRAAGEVRERLGA